MAMSILIVISAVTQTNATTRDEVQAIFDKVPHFNQIMGKQVSWTSAKTLSAYISKFNTLSNDLSTLGYTDAEKITPPTEVGKYWLGPVLDPSTFYTVGVGWYKDDKLWNRDDESWDSNPLNPIRKPYTEIISLASKAGAQEDVWISYFIGIANYIIQKNPSGYFEVPVPAAEEPLQVDTGNTDEPNSLPPAKQPAKEKKLPAAAEPVDQDMEAVLVDIDGQETDLGELTARTDKLETDLAKLSTAVTGSNGLIARVGTLESQQVPDITSLTSDVSNLKNTVSDLQDLASRVETLEPIGRNLEDLETNVNQRTDTNLAKLERRMNSSIQSELLRIRLDFRPRIGILEGGVHRIEARLHHLEDTNIVSFLRRRPSDVGLLLAFGAIPVLAYICVMDPIPEHRWAAGAGIVGLSGFSAFQWYRKNSLPCIPHDLL
ncbi:MAG: hypothetical protein LBJ92_01280 [Holosporales bacterium]|nr:hypothetical protein [Holosporales bacterium]